jgi:precorrin-6B methylase 2
MSERKFFIAAFLRTKVPFAHGKTAPSFYRPKSGLGRIEEVDHRYAEERGPNASPPSISSKVQRMETALYIFLAVLGLAIVAAIIWRLASRRQSLPCPVWLRWLVELDNPFTKTNRAAVIVGHLGLQPGMVVLDVGCGPGRVTIPVAKKVGEQGSVVAMDIQPGMLNRAQKKARAADLNNIRFLHGGVGEGKLGQDQFDRALLVTVLGEIVDPEAAMLEIFNALKCGGILSVTEVIFDPHFQGRRTVVRLAETAGFREKAIFGNRLAYTLHLEKPLDGKRSDA